MLKKSIELINYEIKTDGFSVLEPSCHEFDGLDSIVERFRSSSSHQEFNNPYKVKIFKKEDLDDHNNLDIKHYHNHCLKMVSQLDTTQNQLYGIFQTLDTPDSKHIAQDPHFDRIPTLKFMLYANDLTTESGAFCLSIGSHIWTKENFTSSTSRPLHGANGFLEFSRNIPEPILSRLKPIEGEAGTLIIFDTDCIHHQGIVATGEAHIIRSHYRASIIRSHYRASTIKKNISKLHFIKKIIKKYNSVK